MLEAGENYNDPDSGNDTLIGNAGSDVLYADPGGDQLFGGPATTCSSPRWPPARATPTTAAPATTRVSYGRSDAGLTVELGGTGGPGGCGKPDQVGGDNESLEGSDGPDVLIGDNGENSFLGHLGADDLHRQGRQRLHRRPRRQARQADQLRRRRRRRAQGQADPDPTSC